MSTILILGVLALFLCAYRLNANVERSNPVLGFLFFNTVMAVGILLTLDFDYEPDRYHGWLLILTACAFFVGGQLALSSDPSFKSRYDRFFSRRPVLFMNETTKLVLWIIIVVSLLVSTAYFVQVGYVLFLDSIVALFTGREIEEFSTKRLAAYADRESYTAAGYVNQFKNILLPLCIAALIVEAQRTRGYVPPLLIGLVPITFILILGTGQKGAFVQICIALLFIFGILREAKKINPNVYIAIIALGCVYLLATILQGRATIDLSLSGFTDLFDRVIHRILGANQISAVTGFRFVFAQETVWGMEWLEGLMGLSPTHSGSRLSNIIFSIMFVSDRGTSPPSVWVSAMHNFGMAGAFVFGAALGFITGLLYRRLFSGPRTLIRCICYGYAFAHISMWIAGGPVQLINNGIVTIVILNWIVGFSEGRPRQRQRQRATVWTLR